MVTVTLINHSNYGVYVTSNSWSASVNVPAGTTLVHEIFGGFVVSYYEDRVGTEFVPPTHPKMNFYFNPSGVSSTYEITNTGIFESTSKEGFVQTLMAIRDKKIKPGSIDDYYGFRGPYGTSLEGFEDVIRKESFSNILLCVVLILGIIYIARRS